MQSQESKKVRKEYDLFLMKKSIVGRVLIKEKTSKTCLRRVVKNWKHLSFILYRFEYSFNWLLGQETNWVGSINYPLALMASPAHVRPSMSSALTNVEQQEVEQQEVHQLYVEQYTDILCICGRKSPPENWWYFLEPTMTVAHLLGNAPP